MQGLRKVMRIVISLGFCVMRTSSAAIILRNIVGTVNEWCVFVEVVFSAWVGVIENNTRLNPP